MSSSIHIAHKNGKSSDSSQTAETPSIRTALEELCSTVGSGGRIPGHVELMQLLGGSERAVRNALKELQSEGRLTRKKGVGTFVSEWTPKSPQTSRTIVAIARPDRSFFDRCVEILYRYTEELGLTLVLKPTIETANHEGLLSQTGEVPCGYLVFGFPLNQIASKLQQAGHRTVVVGAPPAGITTDLPCVYNDHQFGGYLVAKHLIGLGHTRIASWQVLPAERLTETRRWLGYQRAVAEAKHKGIEIEWTILADKSEPWESNPSLAKKFFQHRNAPTALVSWNDSEAVRLLITLMRAGVEVPQQVSVVGYDDLPDGELAFPALTTVHHAIEQQIDAAVQMLLSSEEITRRHTVVIPSLVVRYSTAPPASSAPLSAVRG